MSVQLRYSHIKDKKGRNKCPLSWNIMLCSERKIFIITYTCEMNFLY